MPQTCAVRVTVNGVVHERDVEPRRLLADFIRHDLHLTGTHLGCEHGVCGACTVMVDGVSVRSCLILAPQVDGAEITTVEGLAPEAGQLSPLQAAFQDAHALQCGFCTPGVLMTAHELLRDHSQPTDAEIREAISGHICRCTGYQNIVLAIQAASQRTASQ